MCINLKLIYAELVVLIEIQVNEIMVSLRYLCKHPTALNKIGSKDQKNAR